jgi:hypothetical protein
MDRDALFQVNQIFTMDTPGVSLGQIAVQDAVIQQVIGRWRVLI